MLFRRIEHFRRLILSFSRQVNIYLEESSDSEAEDRGEGSFSMLRLDDWATFRAESSLIHLALQLRQKWSALFLRRLNCPAKQMTQVCFILMAENNV